MQLGEKTEGWPLLKRGGSHQLSIGLLYLLLKCPNIKHIAYLYSRSLAYLAGMKINHGKSVLHSLFKCIDNIYFFPSPKSKQISHILFSICEDKMKLRIV